MVLTLHFLILRLLATKFSTAVLGTACTVYYGGTLRRGFATVLVIVSMELFTNMCRLVHQLDLIALLYEHLEFNIRRGQVVKLWAVAHVHVMVPEVLVWLGSGSGT